MIEPTIEVPKVWGKELWLVNNEHYCGKLLFLNKGCSSSLHAHPVKQETFGVLEGEVQIRVEDDMYQCTKDTRPITIMPGQKHSFRGITNSVILEVSTHHEDSDVVRYTCSQSQQWTP